MPLVIGRMQGGRNWTRSPVQCICVFHCHADRPTAGRRRFEESKIRSCSFAAAAWRPTAGRQGLKESQTQTACDLVLLVFVILSVPDARSAWRRTPLSRVPLAHWRQRAVYLLFDASTLRLFDATVSTVYRVNEHCRMRSTASADDFCGLIESWSGAESRVFSSAPFC
jgi:hypothetical protein